MKGMSDLELDWSGIDYAPLLDGSRCPEESNINT